MNIAGLNDRRLTCTSYYGIPKLKYVTIEFKHQGGAGMEFLWDVYDERYDIILFCLGSNNLDSVKQPVELFKQMMFCEDRYGIN